MTYEPIHGESWKQVSPKYLLSNMGRWWSVSGKKFLKQRENSSGYLRVYALLDGKKDVFTHIKVVVYFGDRNGNMLGGVNSLTDRGWSIDHVDGDKHNNRVSNLEIVTHKENCRRREISRACKRNLEDDALPW